MKELLLLCTKNVHFSFNGHIYLQKDGIVVGYPLSLVIAGIFMVELERSLLPKLSSYMTSWKHYVYDTITYVKPDAIDLVLSVLNSFHENNSFTYEQEINGRISFLCILILRNGNSFETTVHRKSTHNDIYLHWESFAPNTWKRGTLRTLVLRAHAICSTKELLDQEINHLQHVFVTFNGYPKWVVLQVLNKVEIDLSTTSSTKNQQPDTHTHLLVLPYKEIQGEHTLKHTKHKINKVLPEDKNMQLVYTGTMLGTKFNVKDKTKKEHHHDLTYSVKYPMKNCPESYNDETG